DLVIGLLHHEDILLRKLLCENGSHQDKELNIIPIVGMGGLGKTTLAQVAYNNENVLAHFDKRIWICFSDPFEMLKVAEAIIEAIEGNNASDISKLETVLQRVRTCIEGKR
ncbi:NB-ARC domain containing protein, partial [Trema orientale]